MVWISSRRLYGYVSYLYQQLALQSAIEDKGKQDSYIYKDGTSSRATTKEEMLDIWKRKVVIFGADTETHTLLLIQCCSKSYRDQRRCHSKRYKS